MPATEGRRERPRILTIAGQCAAGVDRRPAGEEQGNLRLAARPAIREGGTPRERCRRSGSGSSPMAFGAEKGGGEDVGEPGGVAVR
jgi:hypothetical protein